MGGGLVSNSNQGVRMNQKRRQKEPTKELLAAADTEKLCKMVRDYRDTPYHYRFLDLLLGLDHEWSDNELDADDIVRELQPEEKHKLLQLYDDASKGFKQNPLIVIILDQRKRKRAAH